MHADDRDEWLNLLLATRVEPQLGRDRPEILYHYPASQASLAKVVTTDAGYEVAERFELYYRGIELANGFHELGDAAELRRRFEAVNVARVADGRAALPLPESLLAALEHGLPPARAGARFRSAGDAGRRATIDRRCDDISRIVIYQVASNRMAMNTLILTAETANLSIEHLLKQVDNGG